MLESKYAHHGTTAEQELRHFRNHFTLQWIEIYNQKKKAKKKSSDSKVEWNAVLLLLRSMELLLKGDQNYPNNSESFSVGYVTTT